MSTLSYNIGLVRQINQLRWTSELGGRGHQVLSASNKQDKIEETY